jgi:hypothetical protein
MLPNGHNRFQPGHRPIFGNRSLVDSQVAYIKRLIEAGFVRPAGLCWTRSAALER